MMNRREFLVAAGAAAALAAPGVSLQGEEVPASKKKQPNLLFVFADQLGRNHCGYAGATKAKTPNIDAFAAQSVDFKNAVSSMPVCAAYRASLLTGKYTTSTGMVINELRMNTNHTCLGHVVTRAGYQTSYIGKWHLYANELGNHEDPKNSFVPPGPDRLGFDGLFAAYGFHHEYFRGYYHLNTPAKLFYGDGVYEPDAQTNMMIRYLREQRKPSTPFCAFLSYGTPHDPWHDNNVPKEFLEMFRDTEFPNPPNYKDKDDEPYTDNWGRIKPEHRALLPAWRKVYYAMMANLDRNFGRLMKCLEETGLAEDTIVVFSSDHGDMLGAQGRRAKNIFYEEACRVPFLVRWPKHIPAGSVSETCVSNVDFMPTLLGLMGLPIPQQVEGTDCSQQALGKSQGGPEAALLQNTGACAAWKDGHEWRALRDKRYTYAIYRVDHSELLFDNVEDPYQMKNLAKDPAHTATMERFRTMLASKMKSINDNFECCTWYRDHWIQDRKIVKTATMV